MEFIILVLVLIGLVFGLYKAYDYFILKPDLEEVKKLSKQYFEFENERFKNQQIMNQEFEDRQYYSNYKSRRSLSIMQILSDSNFKTKIYCLKNPDFLDEVTEEEIEKYENDFNYYVKTHDAFLNNDFHKSDKLKIKEFVVQKKNPFVCSSNKQFFRPTGLYTIHDNDTAKYKDEKSLEKQFNKEYNLN